MALQDVVSKIEAGGDIPTIAPVVGEVMRLVSDPDADFRSVAAAVSRDPSLTAKVLKVANSAYYGVPGEVATVERAVGLLGLFEVRNITVSVSVITDLSDRFATGEFNWDRFWEHSSGCALIARVLCNLLRLPTGGAEYVGGLLHDVGKILLGHHFPEDFARALELASAEGLSMEEAEERVFGTGHAELGHWLASHWAFPSPIPGAIAWHHRPQDAGDGEVLAAVVHLADLLAKVKCIGFGGDFVAVCLAEDPAWKLLARVRGEVLGALDVERFTYHLDREVDAARELLRAVRTP